MPNNDSFDRYYAIPSNLLHNGSKEEILKLYGSLVSSDKTKKINVYSSEIAWKAWPTNIALLAIMAGIGFLLSSGSFAVALFTFVILAPLFHWHKVRGVISFLDDPQYVGQSKPLTETGKESLHDHLVEIGQISQK